MNFLPVRYLNKSGQFLGTLDNVSEAAAATAFFGHLLYLHAAGISPARAERRAQGGVSPAAFCFNQTMAKRCSSSDAKLALQEAGRFTGAPALRTEPAGGEAYHNEVPARQQGYFRRGDVRIFVEN